MPCRGDRWPTTGSPRWLTKAIGSATFVSVAPAHKGPLWSMAYGAGALWTIAGWEQDTMERIDSKTNTVERIPLGRLGEASGWRYRIAVGEDAVWVLARGSLWRLDSTTKRFLGSVPLLPSEGGSIAAGDGAVWIANSEGMVLRVDPDSQKVTKTIPLGTLVYPADSGDAIAVAGGSVWVAVTSFAS